MIRNHRTWLASLVVLLVMSRCAEAGDNKTLEALRQGVIEAESGEEAGVAYEKLFVHAGRKGMRRLMSDNNTGIALQAAWEIYKKDIQRPKPIVGRSDRVIDKKSVDEFLGFYSKRTGATIPKWWRNTIRVADVIPNAHCVFFDREQPKEAKTTVEVQAANVLITVGNQRLVISRAVNPVEYERLATRYLTALYGAEQSFVAHNLTSYPYSFFCIDSPTGKVRWSQDVWAVRRGFSSGLLPEHHASFQLHDDMVIIYGAETHGMYVEAFDRATGECRYRFCSCYWFHFSEKWGW
jgi:hypothetical protein